MTMTMSFVLGTARAEETQNAKHATVAKQPTKRGIIVERSPKRHASRIHAVEHAREGDDLADVLGAANPGDGALQAHAEAGVGDAAVTAQVEIPLETFLGQFVFAQALHQQIVVVDALAAADDFPVAFGGEHVEGEREVGALGVGLHVEGFDRRGIAVDHHRAIEFVGDDGFFVAADVVAEFAKGCRASAGP